ncbi:MAG: tetratricopeptide repeat protein [Burkholderiaceae bacterium]
MKREPGTAALLSLPPEQVELALARIEHSAAFRTSPRHRALLRHMVAKVLDDDLPALKESLIAIEVFGRPAASFDPKLDTIVRVEARRLRARLTNYYRSDGRDTPVRIELPVGSYVPLIATREPAQHADGISRRARDLVERGEHYLRQALSKATLEQALERFDAALRESPDHAPTYVGMGRAWLNLATGWYAEPAIASAHAAEALRQALVLHADNAIAHVLLGAIQHQFERDWPTARRSFERALALAPQTAFVHSAYGCHLFMHNALDDAERELLIARRIDPQYVNTRIHMINLRIAQRRLDDAAAEIEAVHDIAPETMAISGLSALIALLRGDTGAAVTLYERGCAVMPEYPGCFIALAGALAVAGRTDEADALVAKTLTRFDNNLVSPYVQAIYAGRRGHPDAAFALLERGLHECDPNMMQLAHDPSFDGLHSDARWPVMLAALRRPRKP